MKNSSNVITQASNFKLIGPKSIFLFLLLIFLISHSKAQNLDSVSIQLIGTTHSFVNSNANFTANFLNGSTTMDTGWVDFFVNPTNYVNSHFGSSYYLLMSFNRIPESPEVATLNSIGINILGFVPNQTFIVEIPQSATQNDILTLVNTGNFWIKAIKEIPVQTKYTTYLNDFSNNPNNKNVPINTVLQTFDLNNLPTKIAFLNSIGISTINNIDNLKSLIFSATGNQLIDIVNQPWVLSLQEDISKDTVITNDTFGVASAHSESLFQAYNLNGVGITGKNAIVNSYSYNIPNNYMHVDNINTTTSIQVPYFVGNSGNYQVSHCGIMGGQGLIDVRYKGIAPECTIYAYDGAAYLPNVSIGINNATINSFVASNLGTGVLMNSISTVSKPEDFWCNIGAGYTSISKLVDYLAFKLNNSITINSSVSYCQKDQFRSISNLNAASKNSITVGAVDGENKLYNNRLNPFGPVKDGRTKPDLLAQNAVTTTKFDYNNPNVNDLYGFTNEASNAASIVGGTSALLKEIYAHSGSPASLIKCVLLNTAIDIGNPGPDYKSGFGALCVDRAIMTSQNFVLGNINQGETKEYQFNLLQGTQKCKIMIAWTDIEKSVNTAGIDLVNDIDFYIVSPNGTVYFPYVLNPAVPDENATKATGFSNTDHLNNVEQIEFITNLPGIYRVFIKGTTIINPNLQFAVHINPISKCLQLTTPKRDEKMERGKTNRIKWINNNLFVGNGYKIKVSLTFKYSTRNPNSIFSGRIRNLAWFVVDENVPITATFYDFDFVNYIIKLNGSNVSSTLFYDNNFKIKIEVMQGNSTICEDVSDYFSLINRPQISYVMNSNCQNTIVWDIDNMAHGFNIYGVPARNASILNWPKLATVHDNFWQVQTSTSEEYIFKVTSFINEGLIDYLESESSKSVKVLVDKVALPPVYFIEISDPFQLSCQADIGNSYSFSLINSNYPPHWAVLNYQWEYSIDNGRSWVPIVSANSSSYSTIVNQSDVGKKYRLVVCGLDWCEKLISNEITIRLQIDPSNLFVKTNMIYGSSANDYGNLGDNDLGYIKIDYYTSSGSKINPECLTYQWQIAYFNGFYPLNSGSFYYGGYYFSEFVDILPYSVLTTQTDPSTGLPTTTNLPFGTFTNLVNGQQTISGNFQATFYGYQTQTLEWKFVKGPEEYFSRKYPQLLRLKVSNGCTDIYSYIIDPDPFNTILGSKLDSAIRQVQNSQLTNRNGTREKLAPLIYPNPMNSKNGFYIELPEKNFMFEFYDANGRCMDSGNAFRLVHIPNKQYASGIYFLKVSSGAESVTNKILINNE